MLLLGVVKKASVPPIVDLRPCLIGTGAPLEADSWFPLAGLYLGVKAFNDARNRTPAHPPLLVGPLCPLGTVEHPLRPL
jgi:hypothetical protein